jgi:pyridoxal phosphate enzyme (YggS family)
VTQITASLAKIERCVASALERSLDPQRKLIVVAVSKGQPSSAIEAAYAAGHRHFGENYLQEASEKMSRVTGPDISWHYIGRLQSNKTRAVARNFDWVHTVDRLRLAARLNDQRPDLRPPLNVLIQVNLAGEIGKGGLAPERMFRLATEIQSMPRLKLRGLMGIPQAGLSHEQTIDYFTRLAELGNEIAALGADTLSMGMSDDFETAIECGSNCVRIGTAIFGRR